MNIQKLYILATGILTGACLAYGIQSVIGTRKQIKKNRDTAAPRQKHVVQPHITPADEPIGPADVPVQSTMDKNFAIIAERLEEQCIRQYLYLDETLTCASLAKKLGTNTRYLSNYLNHVQHVTFNEYINNLRLDLASNMLQNTDDPMERISVACGFAHMSRFHRAFQKKFNCSPGLYRQQMRAATSTPKVAR